LPYVAITLNELGILDSGQNRMEDARKEFEEALRTCRRLAQKDSETYLPYVAMTLDHLAPLASVQKRKKETRKE